MPVSADDPDGPVRASISVSLEQSLRRHGNRQRRSTVEAIDAELGEIQRERVQLLGQLHATMQETVAVVHDRWSASDEAVVQLGADGLIEAAAEVADEIAPLLEGGLHRCETVPELRHAAQETFACALAVGQQLQIGLLHGLPEPANVDLALAVVGQLLDSLEPYVSRADVAMRRVLLDGESIASAACAVPRAG